MANESTGVPVTIIEDCMSRITHIETKISEHTKTAPKKKRVRDPVQHSHDELRRYHQKRDIINARRRAAYKAKRESSSGPSTSEESS
jgi:hypothetical protein